MQIQPFLRWAGGKRWLVRDYAPKFPNEFQNYYEPFLGGGAVFLSLHPTSGTLSDINSELINTYHSIKTEWTNVAERLDEHNQSHNKDYYYKVRSSSPRTTASRAARFLYLNQRCWNGLYRVNSKGHFNVPIGTKGKTILPIDDLKAISLRLKNIKLLVSDFEIALSSAKSGDFVYIDPPYTVKHNVNGFLKYNEEIFSWEDQERLAERVKELSDSGVKVLVSQADHRSIRELYEGIGKHHSVDRNCNIAADKLHRGRVSELLITVNY